MDGQGQRRSHPFVRHHHHRAKRPLRAYPQPDASDFDPSNYAKWLDERPFTSNEPREILRTCYGKEMRAIKIGPRIGNVKNDESILIEPI